MIEFIHFFTYYHSKSTGLYDHILQNSHSGCAVHTNHYINMCLDIPTFMEHYTTFSVMTAPYTANLSGLLLDTE